MHTIGNSISFVTLVLYASLCHGAPALQVQFSFVSKGTPLSGKHTITLTMLSANGDRLCAPYSTSSTVVSGIVTVSIPNCIPHLSTYLFPAENTQDEREVQFSMSLDKSEPEPEKYALPPLGFSQVLIYHIHQEIMVAEANEIAIEKRTKESERKQEELEKVVEKTQHKLDETDAKLKESQDKLKETEARLAKASETIENHKNDLEKTAAQIAQTQKTTDDTKKDLDDVKKRVLNIEKIIHDAPPAAELLIKPAEPLDQKPSK